MATPICDSHKGPEVTIINELTTIRRHLSAKHYVSQCNPPARASNLPCEQVQYTKWTLKNEFTSMLPKDVKARKDAAAAADREKQG